MCRQSFSMDKISVIMDNVKNKNEKNNKNEKKEITKVDAVIKLLKDKPNSKFLLFSNYDQTFENLIKSMDDENIKHSKVLGSGAVVNKTIQRFTNGEIRVLMLNASNYGSGLNLQMATDIIIYHQLPLELETQVIGRAQRLGRTTELNVYYLLHEYEQNNVTNPSLSLDLSSDNGLNELDKHLGKMEIKNNKTMTKKVNYEIDFEDIPPEIFGENVDNIKQKKTTKKPRAKKLSQSNNLNGIEF
jgi:ERCC4-related helicase